MSRSDAWGMTMLEYNEICNVKETRPAQQVYDKETQEKLVSRYEVKRIING
jgi:hypothetical protein